jgi:hypothetical protein
VALLLTAFLERAVPAGKSNKAEVVVVIIIEWKLIDADNLRLCHFLINLLIHLIFSPDILKLVLVTPNCKNIIKKILLL